jgi:hypothetical protein
MEPLEHMRIIIHAVRMDNPNPLPTIGATTSIAAIPPNRHQAVANLMAKARVTTIETTRSVLIVLMAIKRGQTPAPQTPIDTMAIVRIGLTTVVLFQETHLTQEDSRIIVLPTNAGLRPLVQETALLMSVDLIIDRLISVVLHLMGRMIDRLTSVVPHLVDRMIGLPTNVDLHPMDLHPVDLIIDLLISAVLHLMGRTVDLPPRVDQKEIPPVHAEPPGMSVQSGTFNVAETMPAVGIQSSPHKAQHHGSLIHAG